MLNLQEILQLVDALRKTHRFIDNLRHVNPLAKHIQYPKIPTLLSESIAGLTIKKGGLLSDYGKFSNVVRGGKHADLLCINDVNEQIKVEVKASGKSNFATFGPKDYGADVLLWLLFQDVFVSKTSCIIEVIICAEPSKRLPWRKDRVTLSQLTNDWNGDLPRIKIDFSSLS